MNLLSLRSPAKTCSASQNMKMAMKGKPAGSSNSKLILLREEGWGYICAVHIVNEKIF